MVSEIPEALAFAASHRRRQKTVRLLFVVLIAVAAAGVTILWSRVRSGPCQKLVDTMCTMGGDCRELRAAFERTGGRIPSDKCAEANKKIEGIEKVPAALRPTMVTNVFADVFGTQKLRDTIHDALMTIDFIELDLKKRRSPDAHVKQLLALGPRACWPVLKRLESDEPSPAGREILIRILIDLKGEDLGDDFLPWKTWCLGVVQASVPGAP